VGTSNKSWPLDQIGSRLVGLAIFKTHKSTFQFLELELMMWKVVIRDHKEFLFLFGFLFE
jgi:hypothetical protein